MGEIKKCIKILVGKSEGKTALRRFRPRWEVNFKLGDVRCKDMDWIHLAQDRVQWQAVVNTVMNLQVN
jgi:hypothetical protein